MFCEDLRILPDGSVLDYWRLDTLEFTMQLEFGTEEIELRMEK